MGNVRIGQCKLTGKRGRYVDAHIIPEALTETLWNGKPLTQIDGLHADSIQSVLDSWSLREISA